MIFSDDQYYSLKQQLGIGNIELKPVSKYTILFEFDDLMASLGQYMVDNRIIHRFDAKVTFIRVNRFQNPLFTVKMDHDEIKCDNIYMDLKNIEMPSIKLSRYHKLMNHLVKYQFYDLRGLSVNPYNYLKQISFILMGI
eukprot:NODE_45_length_32908_cov_0.790271.p25 type:complete len:139 gc:universal NODE_45_length_32908_cov_0.790271:23753-24169(+)